MEHPSLKACFLKRTLIPLIFILSLSCLIHSCKKGGHNAADASSPDLSQAKAWYERNYPSSTASKLLAAEGGTQTTKGDFSKIISPDWTKALSYNRFNTDVLELPLDGAVKLGFSLQNLSTDQFDFNKNYSKSSFLILGSQGSYQAYIMTIVADSSYLKNDFSKLSQLSYRKIDPAFSGLLLYFTPQGALVSGWRYSNGHITKTVSLSGGQSGNLQIQSTDNAKLKTLENGCTTSYTYVYTSVSCIGAGGYQNCTYYYDLYILTSCDAMDHNPDPGDGGGPPPGAGGSGPTTTPVTIVDDPCAGKVAAASNFNSILNNNSSISSAIAITTTYGNNNSEAAYSIEYSNNTYTATTPQATPPGSKFSSATIDANTVAIGHGHPAGAFPQPSAWDIYHAGLVNIQHPTVATSLVTSPTDSYAIIVTNRNDFINFSNSHPESDVVDPSTQDFSSSSTLGQQVFQEGLKAYNYYFSSNSIDPATATNAQKVAADEKATEVEIVYFMSNFSTGLAILKKDNNSGIYIPLHAATTTTSNGQIIYSASPCN